jgi:hypothetical protein
MGKAGATTVGLEVPGGDGSGPGSWRQWRLRAGAGASGIIYEKGRMHKSLCHWAKPTPPQCVWRSPVAAGLGLVPPSSVICGDDAISICFYANPRRALPHGSRIKM